MVHKWVSKHKGVYKICVSPTGRAHCRGCKQLIAKGQLRIATTAFVRPCRATRFMRCELCVSEPGFAAAVLAVYGSALHIPSDPLVSSVAAFRMRALITAASYSVTTAPKSCRSSEAKKTPSHKVDILSQPAPRAALENKAGANEARGCIWDRM